MKGRTKWFPRSLAPVRHGTYECLVFICSNAPLFFWDLEWDGAGFLVPFPMIVKKWRGLTKQALAAIEAHKKGKVK